MSREETIERQARRRVTRFPRYHLRSDNSDCVRFFPRLVLFSFLLPAFPPVHLQSPFLRISAFFLIAEKFSTPDDSDGGSSSRWRSYPHDPSSPLTPNSDAHCLMTSNLTIRRLNRKPTNAFHLQAMMRCSRCACSSILYVHIRSLVSQGSGLRSKIRGFGRLDIRKRYRQAKAPFCVNSFSTNKRCVLFPVAYLP